MIRVVLLLLAVAAAIVAVLAMSGDAGRASVTWFGWRADTTAAAFVLITVFAALAGMLAWRLLAWIAETPRRAARASAEARRRQGAEALTRGFLAVAAGDGAEARRLAAKAADLAGDTPGLVRVLAAQSAEAAGDTAAAQAAYSAMLGFPDMRLAGHKGLMQLAQAQGDAQGALRHAEQAYGLARTARWAWRALLEAKLAAGDWDAALDLVKGALDRKIVPPVVGARARAALLAASANRLEHEPDDKALGLALDRAAEAARLDPAFAPGVVMAARLYARDHKATKAATLIEQAWRARPHPALWLAYRDLKTDETPPTRAGRLAGLAALNPDTREARILFVEQALIAGDAISAREAARALEGEPLTARLAGLFARAAFAAHAPDEARMWIARAAAAPQEPDWSDLDPEGRAFAYQPADWARLVASWAETGELVHPRLERAERTLNPLPDLPLSYSDSQAFLSGEDLAPPFYDTGEAIYGEDEPAALPGPADPEAPPPAAKRARAPARRRLANTPRPAK